MFVLNNNLTSGCDAANEKKLRISDPCPTIEALHSRNTSIKVTTLFDLQRRVIQIMKERFQILPREMHC